MNEFTPDGLKAWRARLTLGELGMAAFIGVPAQTYKKWENGTRKPDAAPLALLALLVRIETEAPAMHASLLDQARAVPGACKGRGRPRKSPSAPVVAPQPAPAAVPQGTIPEWMMTCA